MKTYLSLLGMVCQPLPLMILGSTAHLLHLLFQLTQFLSMYLSFKYHRLHILQLDVHIQKISIRLNKSTYKHSLTQKKNQDSCNLPESTNTVRTSINNFTNSCLAYMFTIYLTKVFLKSTASYEHETFSSLKRAQVKSSPDKALSVKQSCQLFIKCSVLNDILL